MNPLDPAIMVSKLLEIVEMTTDKEIRYAIYDLISELRYIEKNGRSRESDRPVISIFSSDTSA